MFHHATSWKTYEYFEDEQIVLMVRVIAGIRTRNEVTHAFVVFQGRALQDEISRLPASEVFTSLGQITFLVTCLRDRFLSRTKDIGRKECNNFVLVLDRKSD